MFIFQQSKEKTWHVLARFACVTIGHAHGMPSLCLNERTTRGSRVDSLSAHHEGVKMCGSCINAIVDAFESYGHHREHMIPCEKDDRHEQRNKEHAEPAI